MMNGRLKQAVTGLVVVTSVSAVGASVTFSQMQGAVRARRAVKSDVASASSAAKTVSASQAQPIALTASKLTAAESAVVNSEIRNHRVSLENGTLTGAIKSLNANGELVNLTDVKVTFLQNGSVAHQATVKDNGEFQATLKPGVYTLVAYGPNGYVVYGVQAVENTSEFRSAGMVSAKAPNFLQVESLAVPASDYAMVYRLAQNHLQGELASALPAAPAPGEVVVPQDAAPQTNLKQHTVRLQDNGTLLGQLRRIDSNSGNPVAVQNMNAFLVKNGSIFSQAGVAADGTFKFTGVIPGTYTFVSAGTDGLSAFSVVVAAPVAAGEVAPVAFQGEAEPTLLTTTPSNPADVAPATQPLETAPALAMEPYPGDFGGACCGGAPAGCCGGGGGGGGGGGFGIGGLLGLAGVGIGAAALASDDGDDHHHHPVSPAGI